MPVSSPAPAYPRIALIGCGRWGRNIARTLARLGALEVIVDPNVAGLKTYAEELGVRVTDDMQEALSDGIAGVAIAAPAVDHVQTIMMALKADKHVFVEKPLALTVADAQACAAEAERRDRRLMVGHLLQYHPAFRQLKVMVEQGDIGDIRHISSSRLNPGMVRTEENALWSMAPHDFSMILALARRDPVAVSSLAVRVVDSLVPDQFHVQMDFGSGLTAQTNVSWLSPFKEHKLVVLGERGALVFEDTAVDPARKLVHYPEYIDREGGLPRFVKQDGVVASYPPGEPLELEMRTFLDCIVSGETPPTGPAEAIPVLALLSWADGSARAN